MGLCAPTKGQGDMEGRADDQADGARGPPAAEAPAGETHASRKLAFGAVTMAFCNAGKIGVQLLLMPLIARLLGPSAYGVYSLAMPSIIFVLMLADAGLGQSLAREDEAHEVVWSSAFWLLLGVGCVLAVLLALWSLPFAALAHQPALPAVMAPLSLTIVLLALSVLPSARLTRRSNIALYSLIDLGANLLASAVALAAAVLHAGVWSLVIQMLTLYGLRALALNLVAFRMPKAIFNWRAVAPHTLVGGGIVATKFTDSMGRLLETGFVSRRFNAAAVGAYGFSNQAAWSMVQAGANPVWTALYVRALQQRSSARLEQLYHSLLRLVVVLTLPATLLVAATSTQLVLRFLGPSWSGSVLLIALVFPSQALGSAGQLAGAALYAQGRTLPQTIVAVIYSSLRIGAVLIPFGGWPAVAIYLAGANLAYFALGLLNARLALKWSLSGVFGAIGGPMLASLAAALAAHLVIERLPPTLVSLIGSGVLGVAVFVAVLCLLDGRRVGQDLESILGMLGRSRGRREPVEQGA
jgi:O-antigen/teichoic acid export membrane protein